MLAFSAYAASKHALTGFAESLRLEYGARGLSVSIFCPPATDAPGYAEENLAKPAAVRRAELRGGLLSADQVGAALCDQIDRDRFVLLPDSKSKLIAAAARLLPHRYWSRLIAVDLTGAGEALRSALARALSVCAMMASG